MNSLSDILETGRIRSFSGAHLREIAFPLGGIGTGTVSLGGRGQLRDWEIFNRPSKGFTIPYTIAGLWAQAEGQEPVTRVLESRIQPPYSSTCGLPHTQGAGLPRLASATFTGVYPFARIEFADSQLPVAVSLTAFNPLIPLDPDESGLPIAILRYRLTNTTAQSVRATVSLSLMNVLGTDGSESLDGPSATCFGQNLNEFVAGEQFRGIRLTSAKYPEDSPRFGSMALLTSWEHLTHRVNCRQPGWPWATLLAYWDDFSSDGRLDHTGPNQPSREGATHLCALALHADLAPGTSAELPFILAWHFPNRTITGCGWATEEPEQNWIGNHYTQRFADAWEAAEYTARNLPELEEKSLRYVRTMLDSTVPSYVVDAAMSNVSTLRTQTCMRTADGEFHAFEGCRDTRGSCPGTCTHVWNYEQVTPFLFPTLARSMRNTEFLNNTDERGLMGFRTLLPLGSANSERGAQHLAITYNVRGAAADGQMGCIMKLYRDWQLSGDTQWLKELWPHAKRALEFAWIEGGWDADKDGVMEGLQHNTWDIEYHGPAPQTAFWYLGALRAAEEMARALGDDGAADTYRQLFTNGSEWWDNNLFNGDYYIQEIRPQSREKVADGLILAWGRDDSATEPIHQVGPGCMSDQLVGQWFAYIADLGYLLNPEHVRQALAAIFRYNFKRSLHDHVNVARTFALGEEPGLVICTWPHGGRPRIPFPYFSEVFTSHEYLVAASLIYEGVLEPALELVRAARSRHDGEKRNPWDEPECGHHYARAMAAWSLIPALSGFHYSAIDKSMRFAPKISHEDFRCFWSMPTAWGSYGQRYSDHGLELWLSVEYGYITLNRLTVDIGPKLDADSIGEVAVPSAPGAQVQVRENTIIIEFPEGADIAAGETLTAGSARPQQQ